MRIRSEDHFSTIAAAYARGRLGYPAALFDHLSGLCEAHARAWDCATGSGQAVPGLASRFRNVIATDISGELLEQAEKFPNVVYTKTPAENSGIGGVHTWSAVRDCRYGGRNDINAAFESQLGQAWPEDEKRDVHWPLHLQVYRL